MTSSTDFQKRIAHTGTLSVVIANGGTKSNIVDTQGMQLLGIEIPATFTAGNISFLKSPVDAVGPLLIVNDLNQSTYTIPVTQGNYYPIDQTVMAAVDNFQLVSSVSQGGARTIKLVLAPLWYA